MRQFSSPRVSDLKFAIYDDGSGSAEYKGRKVGEIDKSTNEIRIKCDQWRTFIDTDLEKEFIDKAENYVSRYENCYSELSTLFDKYPTLKEDYVGSYYDGIHDHEGIDTYLNLNSAISQEINDIMQKHFGQRLSINEFKDIDEIFFQHCKAYFGGAHIDDLTQQEYSSSKVEGLNVTIADDGCATATYKGKEIGKASFYDVNTYEVILNGEREQYFSRGNIKDLFMERAENYILHNKNLFKEMAASGQLNKTAAAELLLTADMITIAELSPFFKEDKKASMLLNETTAEFLINKSPELKQVFEDKGYDNWRTFFENNRGQAYIEANDISDIGITVVINDNKEYPIPLSPAEKTILRDRFDEEVRRRNKEDLEDKDGDHIPDRIDSSYSSEGYRTQNDVDRNATLYDEYRKALVTSDEYEELQAKGFECQKAKTVHDDGRIPIRFKASDKENFDKIIHSFGGKHEGIHI